MHPKEYKKEKKGTGTMTHLQLENSEIIVGVDFANNKRINEILTDEIILPFYCILEKRVLIYRPMKALK